MALPITFDGLGEDVLRTFKQARDAVASIREETEKASASSKKFGQDGVAAVGSFNETVQATAKTLADVNRQVGSAPGTKLAQGLGQAASEAEGLNDALSVTAEDIAKATFAADGLKKQQAQIRAEALKVVDAVAKKKVSEEEGLKIVSRLSKEYAANAAQLGQIEDAAHQVKESLGGTEQPTKSLRTQLREAREELNSLVEASNGRITPELVAAAQRAGELQDRFGDLNDTISAFNPDTKFRALVGVLGNVASGVQAVVAGMGLFGKESEDVSKALLKIQQTTAFVQGLQGLFNGLADNFRNLRTLIVANVAAIRAQAAASAAATGATTGLAGAFNTLKAALLTNPFTAILVGVTAVVAAIVAFTDTTEEAKETVDEFYDNLQRRSEEADRQRRFNTAKALIQSEIDLLKTQQTEQDKLDKTRRDNTIQEAGIRKAIVDLDAANLKEQEKLNGLLQDRVATYGSLIEFEKALKKEAPEAVERQADIDKINQSLAESTQQRIALQRELDLQLDKSRVDNLAGEKAVNEKLVDERKKLNDELLKLAQDLAKRSAAAEQQVADPFQRLELKRAADQQEVADLEKRIKELNAKLGQGNKLTKEQEQQLSIVRIAIQRKYEEDVLALREQFAKERIALIVDAGERERAEFEAQLKAQVDGLVKAGATADEVRRFQQAKRDKFREDQVAKAIDLDEQLALAEVDAIRRGAESIEEFERQQELRRLAVRRQFAERRLAEIAGDTSKEAAVLRAQLQAILAEIDNAQRELEEKAPKFDLFKLLGIDTDQKDAFIADLRSIGAAVQQLATLNIQNQQAQVDAQIEATDQLIEDAQRRRDELQAQLDQALEDQRAGYANNVDAIRQQIALTDQAEAEAMQRKKAAIAERKRLAKEQAVIESVAQASSLLTAGANIIARESLKGIAGVIAGIAFALTIASTFASIRARIKAATADQPQLRHGGELEGPSHEAGGIALVDRRSGQPFAEAEGGEFVVNKKSTRRFRRLIEAINDQDMDKAQQYAITDLMRGAGVQLDREKVTEIVRTKERLISVEKTMPMQGMASLEKRIDSLTDEVRGFREQERNKEQHTADGKVSIKPNRVDRKKG